MSCSGVAVVAPQKVSVCHWCPWDCSKAFIISPNKFFKNRGGLELGSQMGLGDGRWRSRRALSLDIASTTAGIKGGVSSGNSSTLG